MNSVVSFLVDPTVQVVLVLMLPLLALALAGHMVYRAFKQGESAKVRGEHVFCVSCGHRNSQRAKVCANCGRPLIKLDDALHSSDPWSQARRL